MNVKEKIRTRTAPSPTGFAHVGTAYGALFNYTFAKKNEGSYILRLEDTDVKRHVPGAENAIYENLDWLGISWDEGPDKGGLLGPYKQSERLGIYKEKAKELMDKGFAFENEGAIRFKTPAESVGWNDLIRGQITFPIEQMQDFVIVKSDGYPTYNFAVVVDDHLMEISHVIRGEEHISNTPRQIAVYKAFGWEVPKFAHFPTLRAPDHKKLSKRRDPVDLGVYRRDGYLPEALVNFLCLLGWSHPEEKEVFPFSEFIKHFSLDRVRSAGPVFDVAKLNWLNGVYIREKSDKELAQLINNYIEADVTLEFVEQVTPLVKERITKLSEVQDLLEFFWQLPVLGKEMFKDPKSGEYIAIAESTLGEIKKWNLENINNALGGQIKKRGFKTGNFYMAIRYALTGKKITPPINESMVILGQDQVLYRIHEAEKVLISIDSPEI